MDYSEFKAFDNLNTEIIILDGDDFKLLWINDAAKAANWIGDSSKFEDKSISSLLNEETGSQINEILQKTRENSRILSGFLKNFIDLRSCFFI